MGSVPTLATATDNELADDVDEYAAYIRQVTGDGEAIVDCLIRIMEDDSVGAKPYERLDAQLLLDSIGFGRIAVDQAASTPQATALPATPPMPAAPRLAQGRQRRDAQASRPPPLRRDPLSPPAHRQAEDRQGQEDGRLPQRRRQGRDERLQAPPLDQGREAPRRAGLLQGGRPRASRTLRSGRHEAHRQALPRLQALPPGRHEADHPPRLQRYGRR